RRARDRFIVGRAVLRLILAGYVHELPRRLRFDYGPHGKPALAHDGKPHATHFNVSHSQGLAVYAITRGKEIGIDIEYVCPARSIDAVAETAFSPWELAALQSLPPDRRQIAFFTCWTRKEAYLKARGEGLSLPLEQFDVSLAPGEPAALLDTRW